MFKVQQISYESIGLKRRRTSRAARCPHFSPQAKVVVLLAQLASSVPMLIASKALSMPISARIRWPNQAAADDNDLIDPLLTNMNR